MCQRAVGSPFAALATVDRHDLTWTAGTPALFQSSSIANRGFCARCGTPLTYERISDPVEIEITIGSLDEPAGVPPMVQHGVEGRLAWLDGLDTLPASVTEPDYDGITSLQYQDRARS